MIYPVIPSDKLAVIQVEHGLCIVARYQQTGAYTFTLERAANWTALEADARAVVEDLVGAIVEDDVYPCPDALAERAEWPE